MTALYHVAKKDEKECHALAKVLPDVFDRLNVCSALCVLSVIMDMRFGLR